MYLKGLQGFSVLGTMPTVLGAGSAFLTHVCILFLSFTSVVLLFNSCLASTIKHTTPLWCHTMTWFQYLTRGHFFSLLNVLLFPAFSQYERDRAGELTCECVMHGEHVGLIEGASITVLVPTWWEMLLGSSSPSSSERMDVWLWSHHPWTTEAAEEHPSSWVLRVPLIGDHVFVPDRLWNGVLLHRCVPPASHQGDWLVWSCGMFPSGLQ